MARPSIAISPPHPTTSTSKLERHHLSPTSDDDSSPSSHHTASSESDSDPDLARQNFYRSSISALPTNLSSSSSASEPDAPYTPTRPSLHHLRTSSRRSGTPRTARRDVGPKPAHSRPGAKRATREEKQDPPPDLPLVLLHVTLLPLPREWGCKGVEGALKEETRRRLELLRGRVGGEVGRRGLLVAHPGGEYEVLEERVLRSLGVEGRRVEDGHFVGGVGMGEDEEVDEEEREEEDEKEERVDSGTEGEEGARKCGTCCKRVGGLEDGVGGKRRWDVQVFAGNGRMTADTWALSWGEMEMVDVLVTPWVSGEERTGLEKALAAEAEQERFREKEEKHEQEREAKELKEAHAVQAKKVQDWEEEWRRSRKEETEKRLLETAQMEEKMAALEAHIMDLHDSQQRREHSKAELRKPRHTFEDLPPAFKPEQVPIEVLLRNYLLLLAKDFRNIAIVVLLAVTVMLSMQVVALQSAGQLDRFDSCKAIGQSLAESLAQLKLQNERVVANDSWIPIQQMIGPSVDVASSAAIQVLPVEHMSVEQTLQPVPEQAMEEQVESRKVVGEMQESEQVLDEPVEPQRAPDEKRGFKHMVHKLVESPEMTEDTYEAKQMGVVNGEVSDSIVIETLNGIYDEV
ncbi:hypothetical protein B9Z65_3041 [Elsinoe australis]|uniref:Uncharacterized protein n=1 Tax=Elsinoe australis TaxID=40998 RepID=A0A2P7ZU84_9PEZI|nr:hypothetical protein B9Z65_3041 [Elsinoe australis]